MRENKSLAKHNKWYVLDAPAIWWAAVIVLMAAWLTIGVLNQKKWPAGEKLTTPTIEWTKEIQRVTDTVRDGVSTTQDLQDTIEYARVEALFNEAEAKAKQKTNEEIYASFKEKIAGDPDYTPTDVERKALAKLWIAVNDGKPIPFDWDGKEEQK